MRYLRFRIRNFKGIKDTTVSFETIAGASVFAFVGLNESGKTTVLEAIHSFSPDTATGELLGGTAKTGVPVRDRVPRHQLSRFTGEVSVRATVRMDSGERSNIASSLRDEHKLTLDVDTIPLEVDFERQQIFANGDFLRNEFIFHVQPNVKGPGQRKWRSATKEEIEKLGEIVYQQTPDIAYFPTFVFSFPKRIFLTDRGTAVDKFYRSVFQDILDHDGEGYNIERDIVRRVRSEPLKVSWLNFLSRWGQDDAGAKIQHVIDRASATVTRVVFGRWNRIFGEDTRGKEINITHGVVEGEITEDNGAVTKTNQHDYWITFQIRDGTRRFDVNDRSLGFRWFFAFMLFTQFRVARGESRPLLFLFDEPAANLHAAAQQKLVDCFPEIAKGPHVLAYTTHSHYMIEPKWLEQTFIVTNRADDPPTSVVDAISLDDESLDIRIASYRSFVNNHSNQTSYFQPILDRLDVVPSRFDIKNAGVVIEGKSDYYVLRFAQQLLKVRELPLMPGLGAGTFNALAAMHVGWNLEFLFLLDGDPQGLKERERYVKEYGIPHTRLLTLSDLLPSIKVIEDLLDIEGVASIRKELCLDNDPDKAQVRRFFQERLASNKIEEVSPGFRSNARAVLDAIQARLKSAEGSMQR